MVQRRYQAVRMVDQANWLEIILKTGTFLTLKNRFFRLRCYSNVTLCKR